MLDNFIKMCYNISTVREVLNSLKHRKGIKFMEQRIMTVVLTSGEKKTSVDTNIMVLINKYFDMLYCEKHIIGCTIKTSTGFTLAEFRGRHKI